jgi:hypothetical protein
MNQTRLSWGWGASLLFCAPVVLASEGPRDFKSREVEKDGFTLSKRTPVSLLRDLTPDRPDKTESPYSVDAGYFQIEADFVSFTTDRIASVRRTETLVANILAKAGISRTMDVQVGFSPLVTQSIAGLSSTGVSDLTFRLKWNLLGNEGGPFAVGVLPFVTLPTAEGSTDLSGGVSVPMGYDLPFGFEGGAMATLSFESDALSSSQNLSLMTTVGRDLVGDLGGYVEFFNTLPNWSTTGWVATVDVGLTYGIGPNLQLDAGANIGVSEAADDLNLFTGVTVRF